MEHAIPKVLLLIPTTSYRTKAFMTAADRLGLEVVVGSDQKQSLADQTPGMTLALPLHDVKKSIVEIQQFAKEYPLRGIIGVDEETVVLAAQANAALWISDNPVHAVRMTRDKYQMRQCLSANQLLSPHYRIFSIDDAVAEVAEASTFPCVLKPTFLAASQGVIRADSPTQLKTAFAQIRELLLTPAMILKGGAKAEQILVEQYIPGNEVALEGLLIHRRLKVLALFDKPDPLEGPYFPETIYVTPSRLPKEFQEKIADTVQRASNAMGLREGPIHAELRYNDAGIWLLEIAARSIGGLCSRVLEFGGGISLEELILCQMLGRDIQRAQRKERASGVMMLNVSRQGTLLRVEGLEQAKKTPHIEDVVITIPPGESVQPLPLGARYLGFIFAHGFDSEEVEQSLRNAANCLDVRIAP